MPSTPIPPELAAQVQYLSGSTCCVCNTDRSSIQIHHIDGDPTNHTLENLAVLCLQCHSDAHAQTPFSRKLTPATIKKYREEWLIRVQKRRDQADNAALAGVVGKGEESRGNPFAHSQDDHLLARYLERLPTIHRGQLLIAYPMGDHSCAVDIKGGNAQLREFYIAVLTELARFYPPQHFDPFHPENYFKRIAKERFDWYFLLQGPMGDWGTGSPAITAAGCATVSALSSMILQMVEELSAAFDVGPNFNFPKWQKDWNTPPS